MHGIHHFFNTLTGNKINRPDADGDTRLYNAARDGNISAVRKLLRDGADPNKPNAHGMTPLHQAAYWGELEIMDLLLQAGANPNAHNGKGWTPLHSAALAGGMKSRAEAVERLLKAGAREDATDKNGWTPADYMALWHENADVAGRLKAHWALIGAGCADGDAPNGKSCDKSCAPPRGPRTPRH